MFILTGQPSSLGGGADFIQGTALEGNLNNKLRKLRNVRR